VVGLKEGDSVLRDWDLPAALRTALRTPRPTAPLLFVGHDPIAPSVQALLQPTDVLFHDDPAVLAGLTAGPLRGYVATPESERLRVSPRSFAAALAPVPAGRTTIAQIGWRLDWLWVHLAVGGILCLVDLDYPWSGSPELFSLVLRRFEVLHRGDRVWIGRARPWALPPDTLSRALARAADAPQPTLVTPPMFPLVTRPVTVDAPPPPAEVAAALQTVDLAGRVARRRAPGRPPHAAPPLPVRTGHLALQLACGDFDGVVGTGPHRHVVHGQVARTPVTTTQDGVTTTVDQLRVVVTAVDATGTLHTLMGGGGGPDDD
jgi:hypothetical protein